ncbi:M24 family metallopeptidase [Desulfofustis limnaeus]|jgi:Xaa-Pro aminopeptidase|uniref:Peptidase M24 n=1 Tax=Desulfofustis limnaeus TaxID=2740163 RepID=A0ABM7WDB7_9BACT|nr:Xaa-Pro peptidase family protein [Desulfofustis limnaeus]MDX9894007.1 Xaa-Pro peptidase family protein [Desulfofustis sp.]BDD88952.1 peptidase M24 [Desulfofustis limnaeus]
MEGQRFDGIVPADELRDRLTRLQEAMRPKANGVLIVQKTDLFYYASTVQQGWLYVPAEGQPLLLIFKDYQRACRESSWQRIIEADSPKALPSLLAEQGYRLPEVLGLELDVLPANLFLSYQKIFGDSRIVDISTDIRLLRAVKSPYEIEMIRRAAHCSDQVFAKVPELLAEGRSEVAVAGELEGFARSLGHQGIIRMRMWGGELFYGHLLSGAAAAQPSYLASPTGGDGVSPAVGQGAGLKKIGRNEPILVDYVFALNGYLADHARIFCLGELADDLLAAHQAMLDIQEEVKQQARPGILTGDIYELMVARAAEKGYDQWFMGSGERRIRFTGHGVGLELDEFPFIAKGQKLPLATGMVVALEPKVVIPDRGVVGIENTHLVGSSGLEPLTTSPDTITFL